MNDLPERIKRIAVRIGDDFAGDLVRESGYGFTYATDGADQKAVSLLMPASRMAYQSGDLFPSMDMNLPEGFLLSRILELHPKRQLNKMHLLALMGTSGIGRVGFALPHVVPSIPKTVSKERILKGSATGEIFHELVDAYLSTGTGISGVQPKIMVPTRSTTPIPNLIVKAAGADFPDLSANEFLCMSAARKAGVAVPTFDLSDDGAILVLDRFDLGDDGERCGFEDIAALMGLRVQDKLSNRKYQGSYEDVATVIRIFSSRQAEDLNAFYEQVVVSVLVRNGDAHLKNFGMLYTDRGDARLSPLFDVVTTTMYTYERPGGVESIDRTLALKWRSGKHFASRAYPTTAELISFGNEICGVARPLEVILRIGDAMRDTLAEARNDGRIKGNVFSAMTQQWEPGFVQVREARLHTNRRATSTP